MGDGTHEGREYFICENGYGVFVPISSLQKDDRFSDTSQVSSLEITSASIPLMQHLADGPPNLLIPNTPGPQQSPQPTSAPLRRVSESASTTASGSLAEALPMQESHPSLRPSTSLPHSVVVDSPYHRAHSNLAPTFTQQSPGATAVGDPLGYSPPLPLASGSRGKVDYSSDTNDNSTSEDHEIQPLLEVGDEQIYCLRFAGDLGGLIVGRGGSNVRMVEEESHAKVHVMKNTAVTEDVRVLVAGTKERCMRAIRLITDQLKHKTANLQKYTETIHLTDAMAGKVIGQDGMTIKMIEACSGAVLQVERRPEGIQGLFGVGMRKCKICGSHEQVEKAKSLISDIQQGKDMSTLQLAFAFSQLLRSMPQGVSVLNQLDASEQDEVLSVLDSKL